MKNQSIYYQYSFDWTTSFLSDGSIIRLTAGMGKCGTTAKAPYAAGFLAGGAGCVFFTPPAGAAVG